MYTDVHFLMMPSVAASLTDTFAVRRTSQIVCRFSLMLRNGVMQQFPKFILWKLLHFKERSASRGVDFLPCAGNLYDDVCKLRFLFKVFF